MISKSLLIFGNILMSFVKSSIKMENLLRFQDMNGQEIQALVETETYISLLKAELFVARHTH